MDPSYSIKVTNYLTFSVPVPKCVSLEVTNKIIGTVDTISPEEKNTRRHTNLLSVSEHQDDVSLFELEQAVFGRCIALHRHSLVGKG
ncbi:hypothetical protein EYF80_011162 [Liparis tanakae]|uniref:Uncharacterized protein n=1 Tax=Liparis tanakae TaxID=230148 RepID=A0A4Z2ILD3_9TELE|nr:hypothetical protein EYF80_011162 [Liparis tanakae]